MKEKIDLNSETIDLLEKTWTEFLAHMLSGGTTPQKFSYDEMLQRMLHAMHTKLAEKPDAVNLSFNDGVRTLDQKTGTYVINDVIAVTRSEAERGKLSQQGYTVVLVQDSFGPADEIYFPDGKWKTRI